MMLESTTTLHLILLHETSLLSLPVFLVAVKSISKKWNLCHFLDVHFVVLRALSHNLSEFGAGVTHSVSGIQLTMETGRGLLFFCITIAFISLTLSNVEGRTHFHKKKTKNAKKDTPVSPPSPASPTIPSDPYNPPAAEPCVFDVTSFGAVGDGSNDDTEAFTSAWKAACAVESGVLLAPADHQFTITSTIFSGPCQPGLVFQLDGALVAPNGPDCWPEGDSKNQWLVFYKLDGMTLTGSGTIEGNGEQWWELPCKPHRGPNGSTLPGPCESPALIRFFMSSNLEVSGIRIQNSPQFHMKFDGCTKVLIQDISIDSPALSPNTDGIHIQDSKGVGIYNSLIANGDDCVSIGPGCSGVAIENITCDHGHGISIGSLGVHHSQACVSNIDVNNVYIKNSDNGVRIKTWQGGMGSVAGIKFENIQMKNVKNCIIIDQYYCFTKGCKNESSAVYVTDVSYKYIKGTYDVRTPPVHFACSDSVPCTNITLADIELLPEEGEMVDNPFCWNAYGTLETITIPPIDCLQDGKPETLAESANYNC